LKTKKTFNLTEQKKNKVEVQKKLKSIKNEPNDNQMTETSNKTSNLYLRAYLKKQKESPPKSWRRRYSAWEIYAISNSFQNLIQTTSTILITNDSQAQVQLQSLSITIQIYPKNLLLELLWTSPQFQIQEMKIPSWIILKLKTYSLFMAHQLWQVQNSGPKLRIFSNPKTPKHETISKFISSQSCFKLSILRFL